MNECGLLMSDLAAEETWGCAGRQPLRLSPLLHLETPAAWQWAIDSRHFSPQSAAFLLRRCICSLQTFQPLHLFVVLER